MFSMGKSGYGHPQGVNSITIGSRRYSYWHQTWSAALSSHDLVESLLSRYLLDLYCWSKLIHNLCMRLWITSLSAHGQPAFEGLLDCFPKA